MTDQQTPPAYDPAPSMFSPPPAVQPTRDEPVVRTSARKRRRTGLLAWVGPVLAVLAVVLTYVLLRWSPEPVLVTLAATGLLLVVLAVFGFVAARHGVVAPYVAVGLLLPYLLAASAALGSAERVSSELEDFFGGGDDSEALAFDWDEAEDSSADAPDPAAEAVPFGAAGEFDGFEVTVGSVTCGLTKLKGAEESPSGAEGERNPAAKPEAGKTFCLVESTWTNTTREPSSRSTYDTFTSVVDVDGVRYEASDDDQGYSAVLTYRTGYDGGAVNPGDTVEISSVFSLPEGTQPQYLVAAGFSLDGDDVTYFEVPAG